mmetsp:Transcript_28700/g.60601  ORF Transcript_28700/g.60601 Transcript_28700/m.60601 type:complete len:333 (+) Transcript_28700:206-1204(+)
MVDAGEQVMFNLIIEPTREVEAECTVMPKVLGGENLTLVKVGAGGMRARPHEVVDLRIHHKADTEYSVGNKRPEGCLPRREYLEWPDVGNIHVQDATTNERGHAQHVGFLTGDNIVEIHLDNGPNGIAKIQSHARGHRPHQGVIPPQSLVRMRWSPSNALVLPHERGKVRKIRVLVRDIGVHVMPHAMLMIPQPRTGQKRKHVGGVGIDAPVGTEGEVQCIMPVVANGQPTQDWGNEEERPLPLYKGREARKESDKKGCRDEVSLRRGLGCFQDTDPSLLGEIREVINGKLTDLIGEAIILNAFPLVRIVILQLVIHRVQMFRLLCRNLVLC